MLTDSVPTLAIIVASTRSTRFADLPLSWILERLGARDDLAIEVIDMRDHQLPYFDSPTPPGRAPRVYYTDAERVIGEALDRADGYLVITNEFNHGYSAALKNVLDHYFVEFHRKPIAFVGYGNVGASRAIEQLRQVAAELEMVSTRHAVHIMGTQMLQIRAEPGSAKEIFDAMNDRLDVVVADLIWWATALQAARALDSVPV
ncbi:MAG: NAD(P)H-dependent oxidoreductase [Microbacteriaceae bacterium]|jgi:NAD(P)H-dependent FMN reductase|nr:NAD(P)H-dependent oxidoreductase [Microbacteriaceae bacterium]